MSFRTDKDLRKVVPKKQATIKSISSSIRPAGSSKVESPLVSGEVIQVHPSSQPDVDDIVERAKQERESRYLRRQQNAIVVKIQSWWRGRHVAKGLFQSMSQSVQKRLSEVDTLSKVLYSKGITFVPPLETVVSLATEISFLRARLRVSNFLEKLVVPYCRLMLIPTASCSDLAKNILVSCATDPSVSQKIMKMVAFILICFQGQCSSLTPETYQILLLALRILFLPSSNDTNLHIDQNQVVQCWRRQCITHSFYQMFRKAMLQHPLHRKSLKFTSIEDLWTSFPNLPFQNYSITSAEEFFQNIKSQFFTGKEGEMSQFLFDGLFSFLVDLSKVNEEDASERLSWFLHEIWTIPLLTGLVSHKRLVSKLFSSQSSDSWRFLEDLLRLLFVPAIAAETSSEDYIEAMMAEESETGETSQQQQRQLMKGYYLLGNLLSLFPLIAKMLPLSDLLQTMKTKMRPSQPSKKQKDNQDTSLSSQLLILSALFDLSELFFYRYPIPGLLQGNAGILWHRSGSAHTAVGIPYLFTVQVLQVYDPSVLRVFFLLLFPNYLEEGQERGLNWELYQIPSEMKEIEESLRMNSSFAMIAQQLEAEASQRQSVTSLFMQPSKWAAKLGLSTSWSTAFTAQTTTNTTSTTSTTSATASSSSSGGWFSFFSNRGGSSGKEKATTDTADRQKEGILIPTVIDRLENYLSAELHQQIVNLLLVLVMNGSIAKMESIPWRAISSFTFSFPSISYLWFFLQQQFVQNTTKTNYLQRFMRQFQPLQHFFVLEESQTIIQKKLNKKSTGGFPAPFNLVYLLISLLKLYCITLDDLEFFEHQKPLPIHQMISLIPLCNHLLYQIIKTEPFILDDQTMIRREQFNQQWQSSSIGKRSLLTAQEQQDYYNDLYLLLVKNLQAMLTDFYARWIRRPFFPSKSLWIISETETSFFQQQLLASTSQKESPKEESFPQIILKQMPWSIPLKERLQYFRNTLDRLRLSIQGSNDTSLASFLGLQGEIPRSKGSMITVHHERLLPDAMQQLSRFSASQWRDRIIIRYIDSFGQEEKGIDLGGLFKDFLTDIMNTIIFHPGYGYFITTSDQLFYPNPYVHHLLLSHQNPYEIEDTYYFFGKLLGKAIYENITIAVSFTLFFLGLMNKRYNYMNMLSDVRSLDVELYKNLLFLKTYEGDVSDLALTFSITDTSFGLNQEIELIPNGRNIDVTSANRLRYIHLVAKYYLHDRLKRQASAFYRGLHEVVPMDLLSIFCPPELQVLISGSQNQIDIEDLIAHCQYTGGYHSLDVTITRFWKIVRSLSFEEQSLLLRFVTACPRPPSLGFASLQPRFTIQRVENPDNQRLPSASTCFNILKLPVYSSEAVLREKLLYAITAKAGFDLS